MVRITIDYILSLKPCYTKEELETMFKGRKYVYPQTVINEAKPEDAQWLLLRKDFFAKEQLAEMAHKFAEHVKHIDNKYSRWAANWAEARLAAEAAEAAEAAMVGAWDAEWYAAEDVRDAAWDAELKWQMELIERYL